MQLIDFQTLLEKNEDNDSYPYEFKTYAKVNLNFQDAKDIEIAKTALPHRFLDSINWEEGTAFFQPFHLGSCEHRFRKEETIDAFYRLCDSFNDIWKKYRESSDNDTREFDLNSYYWNKKQIVEEVLELKKSLESRNESIRKCILSLSSEECELLGIKDVYAEYNEIDLWGAVYKEKESVTA